MTAAPFSLAANPEARPSRWTWQNIDAVGGDMHLCDGLVTNKFVLGPTAGMGLLPAGDGLWSTGPNPELVDGRRFDYASLFASVGDGEPLEPFTCGGNTVLVRTAFTHAVYISPSGVKVAVDERLLALVEDGYGLTELRFTRTGYPHLSALLATRTVGKAVWQALVMPVNIGSLNLGEPT